MASLLPAPESRNVEYGSRSIRSRTAPSENWDQCAFHSHPVASLLLGSAGFSEQFIPPGDATVFSIGVSPPVSDDDNESSRLCHRFHKRHRRSCTGCAPAVVICRFCLPVVLRLPFEHISVFPTMNY